MPIRAVYEKAQDKKAVLFTCKMATMPPVSQLQYKLSSVTIFWEGYQIHASTQVWSSHIEEI